MGQEGRQVGLDGSVEYGVLGLAALGRPARRRMMRARPAVRARLMPMELGTDKAREAVSSLAVVDLTSLGAVRHLRELPE